MDILTESKSVAELVKPGSEQGNYYSNTVYEQALESGRWLRPHRILGINGASGMESGATDKMLSAFAHGAETAGCMVSRAYLAEKNIKSCLGCYRCWTNSTGDCVISDDMLTLLDAIMQSDLLVMAAPLYMDGVSGLVKNFLDRLTPLLHPALTPFKGKLRQSSRHRHLPAMALVSVGGLWDKSNFDPLEKHFQALATSLHLPLITTIFRPESFSLFHPEKTDQIESIIEATVEAGLQSVVTGRINEDLSNIVSSPILKEDDYVRWFERMWRIDKATSKSSVDVGHSLVNTSTPVEESTGVRSLV